jgi:transposase
MNATYQLSKINRALTTIKSLEIKERLMLLKFYYRSGSLREVAREYRCSHGKVKYWKDRYESEGLKGLSTQDKSGRPLSVSPAKMIKIKKAVENKCKKESWSVDQVREYIKKKGGKQYTVRHTSRIIHSWGLAMIKPRPQYAHAASRSEQRAFLKEEHG